MGSRTRWGLVVAAAAAVVAGLLTWWLWPAKQAPPPLARVYLEYTACLLTDDKGVTGPEAEPFWAGMQDASLATRIRVQYLSVAGPQTTENAATFLASLAQGGCNLIFAAGATPAAAVAERATTFPDIRFFVASPSGGAPNVSAVEGATGAEHRASVNRIITAAANAASPAR
jgi:hypothetical protein